MRSKRFRSVSQQVDRSKFYTLAEAVQLVKKTSNVKFDASVELHVHLGIDPKKAEQAVRGTVQLPHGTGQQLRIAVFATGQAADEATAAGADVVGGEELIKQIKEKGVTDFDIAVAPPEMMKKLAPIAKTLGTRGLMPNPKNETVNPNPATVVKVLRQGKVAFRSDDTGNIHQVVGRVSFDSQPLAENVTAFLDAIKRAKPAEAKGTYLASATLTSSMGPAVKINLSAT
ncbi:MAG: 50S ribosomal protein L1 [Candidatus Kerfeldbacteria bacterium]|nr:50S ribosomal protein L1 [Candidatus Kerfeldbacteria bacterium]